MAKDVESSRVYDKHWKKPFLFCRSVHVHTFQEYISNLSLLHWLWMLFKQIFHIETYHLLSESLGRIPKTNDSIYSITYLTTEFWRVIPTTLHALRTRIQQHRIEIKASILWSIVPDSFRRQAKIVWKLRRDIQVLCFQ